MADFRFSPAAPTLVALELFGQCWKPVLVETGKGFNAEVSTVVLQAVRKFRSWWELPTVSRTSLCPLLTSRITRLETRWKVERTFKLPCSHVQNSFRSARCHSVTERCGGGQTWRKQKRRSPGRRIQLRNNGSSIMHFSTNCQNLSLSLSLSLSLFLSFSWGCATLLSNFWECVF